MPVLLLSYYNLPEKSKEFRIREMEAERRQRKTERNRFGKYSFFSSPNQSGFLKLG
jgi:hypothetical protein